MTETTGNVVGPLLLPVGFVDAEAFPRLKLPPVSENIFRRLIRNPRAQSSRPRERECTEMLCAVLLNAPRLRSRILRWLGELCEYAPVFPVDDLELRIDTEQPIGAKRDDLRIEAWDSDGEDGDEDDHDGDQPAGLLVRDVVVVLDEPDHPGDHHAIRVVEQVDQEQHGEHRAGLLGTDESGVRVGVGT